MKKILIGFFGSFIFLTFVWFCVAYFKYGNNLTNIHLDLYATINQLVNKIDNGNFDIYYFIDTFDTIKNSINIPWDWLDNLVSGLLVPFYTVANILMVAIDFLRGVFLFVFNPIFA